MMTQKYLYVVPHSIPFPSSEYGGLWNVIAETDEECFDLISVTDEYNGYDKYFPNLRENILKAEKFSLSESEESRVVDAMIT
jgi:hypothetical protein